MLDYQNKYRFFAQTADFMGDLVAAELKELGATNIEKVYLGAYFTADKAALYRINYLSRLIVKVLAPLKRIFCSNTDALYRQAGQIDWSELFSPDQTFAISANVSNSQITHSKYASLCVKDAIVDQFRDRCGKRPSVETKFPDVWLNLHLRNDKGTISLETSGGSLHRRGYRKDKVPAPIQETLAATVIKLSEWDGSRPLYDPMCGSGTFLAEGLMSYCNMPSQFLRKKFGFELLPDFEREIWDSVRNSALEQVRPLPGNLIFGSDSSTKAISVSRENLNVLPYGDRVSLRPARLEEIERIENSVIITNPPFGLRMMKKEGMEEFYKALGDFLKQKCCGCTAYVFCGERELIKSIGLKTCWKKPLTHGGLDGRLVKIEAY